MGTRTFTRDELMKLGVPHSESHVIHREQVDEHRWTTEHVAIFMLFGELWQVTYYEPATEEQECDLWVHREIPGYVKSDVEAVEVEPYTVEVTKYRPVADPTPAA